MGWKSTMDITREKLQMEVQVEMLNLSHLTNAELIELAEDMGFGDDADKNYYGHTFHIIN